MPDPEKIIPGGTAPWQATVAFARLTSPARFAGLACLTIAGLTLAACGQAGSSGQEGADRAVQVQRGPQGTEIEFNPGAAKRNLDKAGHELGASADQAGRSLQRGADEVGQKVGPAARELGQQLKQGAHDLGEKAGPAARQAGEQIRQGARQVGAQLAPAARQAGDALASGARQVGDTVGPAVRRAAADATVSAAVKAKLIADPEVKAMKIEVSSTDGVVTLSGSVPTAAERATAERVAAATDGVQRVINALQIGPG